MIKNIIFDLDGTLLNTLEDLYDSVNYSLSQHNLPERKMTEVRKFLGNGVNKLIEQSVPQGTDCSIINSVLSTFREYYLLHSKDKTKPYAGIIQALEQLKATGIKMAIVSNKPNDAVAELHRKFFSDTVDYAKGETAGTRRKPFPDMVEECLQALNADINESIYVGDSEVDHLTAQNTGIKCCLVTWGFRDKDMLEQLTPDYIIDKPEQIKNITTL